MSVGIGTLKAIASQHTRDVLQDNWMVGNGATTTSVPVQERNPGGHAIDVTGQAANEVAGSLIEFVSGLNQGVSRQVLSVASDGTLTLDTALPNTPSQGDLFVLLRTVNLSVATSENISQVGAVNVPATDATVGVPALPGLDVNLGLYPATNTGAIPATNTATSFTLALATLTGYTGTLLDVKAVSVAVNNSGTAQSIVGIQLVASDSVGGTTVSTTYNGPPLLSIASGTTYTWRFDLSQGQPQPTLLKNLSLVVNFGTAPVAGEVYAQAFIQGAGAPPISLNRDHTQVLNETFNAGEVRYIASGEDMAFYDLTLGGVCRIDGEARLQNLSLLDGSHLILGDGSAVSLNSFS